MKYDALRRNEVLIRRARLRALLNERSGANGISTLTELARELDADVTNEIVRRDLLEMGAVKLTDTIDGKTKTWWAVPSYNPNLPDYREHISEEAILNEISHKMRAHVVETVVIGHEIVFKTERSAGPLIADWLSLLTWPEILHVSEERHAALIKTPDAEIAEWVRARLTGAGSEDE